MKFAKALKEKTCPPLKYYLHRHFAGYQEARDPAPVHASDMQGDGPWGSSEFCARERILMLGSGKKNRDRHLSTSMAVTYAIGHFVEEVIVAEALAEEGVAVANWECYVCGAMQRMSKKPEACENCGCRRYRHRDVRFKSEYSGITCGIDMFADRGDGKLRVVEVKSIDKIAFKKLVAPYAEHRWRTNLYMRCIEESTSEYRHVVHTDSARVLYVSKGGYGVKDLDVKKWDFRDDGMSPFKEYEVLRDDSQTDDLVEAAKLVYEHEKGGSLPDRVCKTAMCKRAEWCVVASTCFGMKGVG